MIALMVLTGVGDDVLDGDGITVVALLVVLVIVGASVVVTEGAAVGDVVVLGSRDEKLANVGMAVGACHP